MYFCYNIICDLLLEKGPSVEMVVCTRKSNIFSINLQLVVIKHCIVQIRIQSGKQYTTCTLHYIVEYIQHIHYWRMESLKDHEKCLNDLSWVDW